MPTLDPRLAGLADSVAGRTRGGSGGLSATRTRIVSKKGRESRVQVLVELDDAQAEVGLDDAIVNGAGHRIRTVYLPMSRLSDLADLGCVKRVVPSTMFEYSLDVAARRAGFIGHKPAFAAGNDDVLIGFIDSGIDGAHPAFGDRIDVVWDQTQHGHGNADFGYGRIFHRPHEVGPSDTVGHGTFVASIAAGQRTDEHGWSGVNPAARIAAVKCGMHDGEILDAAYFLSDYATRRGLPLVLNLSLGAHGGPHDGSGPLSLGLDDLVAPGRIVCCAAGNEASSKRHVALRLEGSVEPVELGLTLGQITRGHAALGRAELLIWLRGDVRGVELKVHGPDEANSTPWIGPLEGRPRQSRSLERAEVSLHMPLGEGNEHRFVCEIESRGISLENWKLGLRSSSPIDSADVWSVPDMHHTAAKFDGPHVSPRGTVGAPGDARRAITVGSWCSRIRVPAPDFEREGTVGQVADFSGRGPLRDGRGKPELVAPGTWLVAARSSAAQVDEDDKVAGEDYRVGSGTSAATAFVSGVVSLLLAEDPDQSPDTIRTRLLEAVRQPPEGGGPEWGAGLVGPAQDDD